MRALERPEAPLARAPFSRSVTRFTPAEASANAMLVPMTPPPMTTTSAVSVTRPILRHREGRVQWTALVYSPPRGERHEERVQGHGQRSAHHGAGRPLGALPRRAVQE